MQRRPGLQDSDVPLGVSNDGVVHLAARGVLFNILDPAAWEFLRMIRCHIVNSIT